MSSPPEPYRDDLAFIHHHGFGAPALEAAQVLIESLGRTNQRTGTIFDLGCGGGLLSRVLVDAGYIVHGVDLSPAMIGLARAHVPEARFEVGSALSARLPGCVGVAAIGEVVNYLFDRRNGATAMARLLRRVHGSLAPGGIFLLDAAGPGRVPAGGPRRSFVEGNGWAVLVEASEDEATGILTRSITSFRRAGDLYRRDQETHRLRLIPPAEMLGALRSAGFRARPLRAYGAFRFPSGWSGFLARKT